MEAHDRSQLVLDWQGHHVCLDSRDKVLRLGSGADADLCVAREFTSRSHAYIEQRKQDFVLIDQSTNGTFVQTEDERITFLRRGELRLWGAGWISLGEPLSEDVAIRFQNI